MNRSTQIASRIIGPLLLVTAVAVLARREEFSAVAVAFFDDAGLTLLGGFVALIAGLTLLAFHHRWDGAAAITVTLVGWLSCLRGALLILAPGIPQHLAHTAAQSPLAFVIAGAFSAALGAWLTYVGFIAKPKSI